MDTWSLLHSHPSPATNKPPSPSVFFQTVNATIPTQLVNSDHWSHPFSLHPWWNPVSSISSLYPDMCSPVSCTPPAPAAITFYLDFCNILLGRFPAPSSCPVPLSTLHTAAWVIKDCKILKGIVSLPSLKHWLSSQSRQDQVENPQASILMAMQDLVPGPSAWQQPSIDSRLQQHPAFLLAPFYLSQFSPSSGTCWLFHLKCSFPTSSPDWLLCTNFLRASFPSTISETPFQSLLPLPRLQAVHNCPVPMTLSHNMQCFLQGTYHQF